jgi:hypothetical protein
MRITQEQPAIATAKSGDEDQLGRGNGLLAVVFLSEDHARRSLGSTNLRRSK